MSKIRVCAIHCAQATEATLSSLVIPKERSDGAYDVKCMISVLHLETREAHIYAEFERVKEPLLRRALEESGASDITITSFSLSDYVSGAGVALKAVRDKAGGPAFQLFERGVPSQYVQPSNIAQPIVDGWMPVDYVKELEAITNEADATIDEKVPQRFAFIRAY